MSTGCVCVCVGGGHETVSSRQRQCSMGNLEGRGRQQSHPDSESSVLLDTGAGAATEAWYRCCTIVQNLLAMGCRGHEETGVLQEFSGCKKKMNVDKQVTAKKDRQKWSLHSKGGARVTGSNRGMTK